MELPEVTDRSPSATIPITEHRVAKGSTPPPAPKAPSILSHASSGNLEFDIELPDDISIGNAWGS
jgi:hypothetical protein